MTFPIHLAVHSWGMAKRVDEGLATRSAFGPYFEALAEAVERVTVLAYDPPDLPSGTEDLTEYVIRSSRNNVEFLSLGPKGDRRDYLQRRQRVARIVDEASTGWDVLLFRIVNRRAHLVFRANRCPRVVTVIGGAPVPRGLPILRDAATRPLALAAGLRAEWHYRRVIRGSGLVFANGEELVDRYRAVDDRIELLRSSARRARFEHRAHDRLIADEVRFLVAGQIKREKGVFEALEVFDRIRRELLPRARLDVAGIGAGLDELTAQVRSRGLRDAVEFHGWVPVGEPFFSLLKEADVLLMLSHTESLPRVVWEALAHSVLVVATDVGSIPRAFSSGEEYVGVPVGDVDRVVEAVRSLLEDPTLRRRVIERGYERAKESTLEHVVDLLFEHVAEQWPELRDSR